MKLRSGNNLAVWNYSGLRSMEFIIAKISFLSRVIMHPCPLCRLAALQDGVYVSAISRTVAAVLYASLNRAVKTAAVARYAVGIKIFRRCFRLRIRYTHGSMGADRLHPS